MPQKHKLSLTIQYVDASLQLSVTRPLLRRWVHAALTSPAEMTLRFVDIEEGRALNRTYRGKDKPTNVLTFAYPADDGEDIAETTRADLVFCSEILHQEAAEQKKSLIEHAAHLVIHGVLHAQGYDHEDNAEAKEMESLETKIMARLGFNDPYLVRE